VRPGRLSQVGNIRRYDFSISPNKGETIHGYERFTSFGSDFEINKYTADWQYINFPEAPVLLAECSLKSTGESDPAGAFQLGGDKPAISRSPSTILPCPCGDIQ
jgi:hypothetical protein